MDLAPGQGGHVEDATHAPSNNNTGGADGDAANQPGSKADIVASKLATQVFSKLKTQFGDQSEDIQTLAQAMLLVRKDIESLKRKNEEDSAPGAKKVCQSTSSTQASKPNDSIEPQTAHQGTSLDVNSSTNSQGDSNQPPSPQQGTSQNDTDVEEVSDDELDNYLTAKDDDIYADLEEYFDVEEGTGPAVGEKVAEISKKALRGNKTKLDDEKLQALKKKHQRPKNIDNLQVPKIDDFLWRQLKREVRQTDFGHQLAVANYCQAMVPIIKAMEAIDKEGKMSTISELVKDAFKMLALNVKLTNMKRLEKIQKELQGKYKSLCQDGPSGWTFSN